MANELVKLEQLIGYRFEKPELLERAVTHRSWAYEKMPFGDEDAIRALQNESLEFVGDSVLGLAIAEQLFNKHTNASEGDLTLMKHHLVSTETLAKKSKSLGLGEYLRVGRGEEKMGGRRRQALLADILEAVTGAIFFDGGYIAARSFLTRIFAEEIKNATPTASIDYKTLLQETLQADKKQAPEYNLLKTEGPPHNRMFFVEVVWEGGQTEAKGTSIKAAEMGAASLALKELKKSKKVKPRAKKPDGTF
jgi:ribonuclease III